MAIQSMNLTATQVVNLGDAREGVVSSWVLGVSGTFVGSMILRKRMRGGSVAVASAGQCWYTNALTNTAVAAGVAITAGGIYVVQADGCDIIIDYAYTSGSLVLETDPVVG